MSDYLHGVKVIEVSDGTRPIRTVATAVIGIVCTSSDADEETFPLDKPILTTNPQALLGKAGKSGTLYRTLEAISNIVRTPTVIVRVAENEDVGLQNANVIGTVSEEGYGTGIKALQDAQSLLGVKPRILAAPGLDTKEVTTALVAMAKKLHAFAYCSCVAKNKEEAQTYRQNFGDRELMLIYGDFESFDVNTGDAAPLPASACAVALRAWADKEIGWHRNISNLNIAGVSGVTKPISFDIQDESTDANFLNSKDISVALRYNGFRIWGGRTTSSDKLFAFEQYTRTAEIIRDTIGEAFDWAIDKPLTQSLAKDILEMINAKFREWKAQGYIVDGEAWDDEDENSKETIKDGKLRIRYKYCPVPNLENLEFRQYITDEYLADFAAKVTA